MYGYTVGKSNAYNAAARIESNAVGKSILIAACGCLRRHNWASRPWALNITSVEYLVIDQLRA